MYWTQNNSSINLLTRHALRNTRKKPKLTVNKIQVGFISPIHIYAHFLITIANYNR